MSPVIWSMRGSRKFCQRGSSFDVFLCFCVFLFFLVDEWREDPNNTISEPS